jgi:hypothetical protein
MKDREARIDHLEGGWNDHFPESDIDLKGDPRVAKITLYTDTDAFVFRTFHDPCSRCRFRIERHAVLLDTLAENATEYRGRDNWYTRGSSIPVLSY